MSRRKTAASIRLKQQRNKALRNVVIVAVALSLIAVLYVRSVLNRRTLDEVTLCPAHPDSVTVLLVDVTDPMTLPQKQDFRNQLDRLTAEIPRFGKLVITKVDPVSEQLLVPIVTRCNPGTGADTSELDGNPEKLDRLHQEQFVAPIQNAYDQILLESEASRSPILESIQSINLTELAGDQRPGVRKRLIVASDLLQNTGDMNFYKGLPTPESLLNTQAFGRVRTDLRGIEVELWMLQRGDSSRSQPRALPDLWTAIIDVQGGRLMRVYTVSG
jgi:hypothetical protein